MRQSRSTQHQSHRVARWLRAIEFDLPGGRATLLHVPGVPGPGASFHALRAAAREAGAGHVLVAGPGSVTTALWAARSGASVTHWSDSLAESLSLLASFNESRLPPPETHVDWDYAQLAQGSCHLALVHLPRGRALQAELLQAAAAVLTPGGKLVYVGAKNEGVKGATDEARRIFGSAGIVSRKGGYHAGVAVNRHEVAPFPTVEFRSYAISVAGSPTELVSCVGVFADDRLDAGAAALIRGMDIRSGAQVLDLGCGTGLVGLTALRRGAAVVATDVSARAVASAHRTLAANGFPAAPVELCFGASAVPDETMDTVVTNPPFHRGHDISFDVAELFVAEAARVLRTGGELFLVANAFLDYTHWLQAHFRSVQVAWADARFRVWCARK